jgi:hypothetical protein
MNIVLSPGEAWSAEGFSVDYFHQHPLEETYGIKIKRALQ